jgi:deoxyribodipyrimidine photo-lyase
MAALFLFHRDLRIVDHNGLRFAKETYKDIIPLFIFTPEQVSSENKLKSNNSVQFMIESLKELESDIQKQGGKLYFAYGKNKEVLEDILKKTNIKAIVETADYTPYAKERTKEISDLCEREGIEYHGIHDSYLLEPGSIKTGSGRTFQKFTPFYRKALEHKIEFPHGAKKFSWKKIIAGKSKKTRKVKNFFWNTSLDEMEKRFVPEKNPDIAVKGGRQEALELIKHIPAGYAETHDIPSINTSLLSAHNHYGTVSIREVHEGGKGIPAFQRQLWWRDFYGHIMADFENLYGVGAYEFEKKEYEHPLTPKKKEWFEKWCRGETGIRLVDAGMKQMLKTGWMHNRVRLVVSSWLTKDMKIHWRHGERFFAKHLVDYDATQNMMNWIWIASALPFASAPFRKVSAKGTAEKFDPDEKYVKEWLGE